jgi:hypothetical protein
VRVNGCLPRVWLLYQISAVCVTQECPNYHVFLGRLCVTLISIELEQQKSCGNNVLGVDAVCPEFWLLSQISAVCVTRQCPQLARAPGSSLCHTNFYWIRTAKMLWKQGVKVDDCLPRVLTFVSNISCVRNAAVSQLARASESSLCHQSALNSDLKKSCGNKVWELMAVCPEFWLLSQISAVCVMRQCPKIARAWWSSLCH